MKMLAFFFALVVVVHSAEKSVKLAEVTISGKIYKQATISLPRANEALIAHESGSKRISSALLPKEIQLALGYDSSAAYEAQAAANVAADLEADRAAVAARTAKIAERSKAMTVKVISITGTGLLCIWRDETIFMEANTEGAGYLSDYSYKFQAAEMGVLTYTTVLGAERTVKRFADIRTYGIK